MKYLITGSNGFIGSALSKHTTDNVGFDIKQDSSKSVANYYAFENYIKSVAPDVIVHLAAISGIKDCIDDPEGAFQTNVKGATNVLDLAKKYKIKRVIMASSAGVIACPSPYHAHKRYLEDISSAYHITHGVSVCCLRFSNVYGIGSIDKSSVIANMFKEAITSGIITVEGGKQSRDFVCIDDVVRGIIIASESNYSGTLNIGGGNQFSINEIATKISNLTKAKIVCKNPRPNDVKDNYVDIGFSEDILDWHPYAGINNELNKTYNYFKESILSEAV